MTKRSATWLLAALMIGWACPASSQTAGSPGPVLSDTGPDADSYGAAAHYPTGTRQTSREVNEFGVVIPGRAVRREPESEMSTA